MRLSRKITIFVVVLLSFIIATSFYYAAREKLTQTAIKQYVFQSDIHQKALLDNLQVKRSVLSLLAKKAAFHEQFDAQHFIAFLGTLNPSDQYNEICLFMPEVDFMFSTKSKDTSDCAAFDELHPNQVINVNNSPKLILTEYVANKKQSIYISIIIDLNKIVDGYYNTGFDEYILAFDTGNLLTQYYALNNGQLMMHGSVSLEDTLKHRFYTIEIFDDIQLLYLSTFKKSHLPDHIFLLPLLIALAIFLLPSIGVLYWARLMRQKEKEEAHSQRFINLILENLTDIVFVKDQSFTITYANQNFLNMYPESQRDKVIGYTSLEGYQEEEMEAFLAMDKKAFAEGYSEVVETITFPDMTTRTLLTKKTKFTGGDGKAYILGTATDITQQEQLIKQLEYKNEELMQFAYRTSHDLKSPIMGIERLAEFIEDDIDDGNIDEVKSNIGKIASRAKKLLTLVSDILALTKVDHTDSQNEEINFIDLIQQSLVRLEDLIQKNDIQVALHVEDNIHFVSSAPRVSQVLENLISNALKYHDPNKQEKSVVVDVKQIVDAVVITVQDNGIGIPEGKEDVLFDMFTRFNVNLAEGSGLGLAIVKKHVEKLNGTISAETKNNATFFIVRLKNNAKK